MLKQVFAASLVGFFSSFGYAKAPASTPKMLDKGQSLFKTNCMVCHGEKGDGNGPAGATLTPKARNFVSKKFKFGSKPEQVFKTITEGSKNTSMTGWSQLPEEIAGL